MVHLLQPQHLKQNILKMYIHQKKLGKDLEPIHIEIMLVHIIQVHQKLQLIPRNQIQDTNHVKIQISNNRARWVKNHRYEAHLNHNI